MSYIVLARKYRPENFDQVIGQDHITRVLSNTIRSQRIAHAYLFCGPRGIGKTSCARIFARSLNCEQGPVVKPCGNCPACRDIANGSSFDVLEIDGASNRGIDEIRSLRENVKFAPSYGRYKIYIIDEVHMLTMEAFNALLKTLEEPPEHVKFIFATTDPNKVPATIISRCQRFDFKRVMLNQICEVLGGIAEKEGIRIDQGALYAVAKAAQGSMRDALSILDQVSAISEEEITSEDIHGMLGLVEADLLFRLSGALGEKNCGEALAALDEIISKGKDIRQLSRDLVDHYRNLMIIKVGGKGLGRLVDYPIAIKEQYLSQAQNFSLREILDSLSIFINAQDAARVTESLRIPLEIAFARISQAGRAGEAGGGEAALAPGPSIEASAPAVPASQQSASRAGRSPGERISPMKMLENERGQVDLDPAPPVQREPISPEPEPAPERKTTPSVATSFEPVDDTPGEMLGADCGAAGSVDIEKIRKLWNALTFAVSKVKMSLATYLQEGAPVAYDGRHLKIGFKEEFSFYKETLDDKAHIRTIEDIFAEKLKVRVSLSFVMLDGDGHGIPEAPAVDDPLLKKTLDAFGGKVVSQWHNS